MAGNKINTKTKTKEDKGKPSKPQTLNNEVSEDPDLTLLRKPIHTSVTGFAQARKIFDFATEELKGLLSNECDILYECKVCRNIFRSLANFISHKRIYCKDNFNASMHGHFVRTISVASEISKIKKLEEIYKESLKENESLEISNENEPEDRIPFCKDLTEIIEKLASSRDKANASLKDCDVVLQKIPKSSVAVFQSVKRQDDSVSDLMRSQVMELNEMLSRKNAVLQNDGKFEVQPLPTKPAKEPENVIQISDDEDKDDNDVLKCKICDLQFSTQKTLKFHMKYKHLESRLVYPCPDCLEIFSTSWSVYRHLFKVHRKTAAQIRRLREPIQAKAFRMNNPPAFYERRKNNSKNVTPQKITEEERLEQENQAWMDNMEGDGEVPRCGGCGRTFERRAALAAHTHTCQPRTRALARRPPDARKIEIQIRKDYNKTPTPVLPLPVKLAEANENKQASEETLSSSKPHRDKEKVNDSPSSGKVDKSPEKNQNKKIDGGLTSKQKIDDTEKAKVKSNENSIMSKLPFARQIEKRNINALKQKCQPDIEFDKLSCNKCDNTFDNDSDLYEHMAGHYKWYRYACKLCNYKHYNFEKLPEHVKIVHKLKGDTDFYFSTVKAVDATEALQLAECSDDINEGSETSPDSRHPSRCSSDSSRLSDDSSSSSTRVEGTRKRKMKRSKNHGKRKKESPDIDEVDPLKDNEASVDTIIENDSSSSVKVFEENSSDIDVEVEDKTNKKQEAKNLPTVTSRRPVRKRTKPQNEDFEYDLSNLLKLEAQGYRDTQVVVTAKACPAKKKNPVENQNNNEINDKEYCGALAALSKKAVENSLAHMKSDSSTYNEVRPTNIFLMPLLPKISRIEKISSKRDIQDTDKVTKLDDNVASNSEKVAKEDSHTTEEQANLSKPDDKSQEKDIKEADQTQSKPVSETSNEVSKTNSNVSGIVPVQIRQQSLEVIKNPLIKKNITDFTKAGMKTKILVIKPIHRSKEGGKTINTPLKFQTIKLKDSNKSSSSNEDTSSDQVMVVQVPKVECNKARSVIKTSNLKNECSSTANKIAIIDVKERPSICKESESVLDNIERIKSPDLITQIEISDSENINGSTESVLQVE